MIIELIVIYGIQDRAYRDGINSLLVLLIGGIPIAMPTVLSVTMAIGSHRLSQQVCDTAKIHYHLNGLVQVVGTKINWIKVYY